MERHFATVWESVADVVGDEVAIVQGDLRRTWHDFDHRSSRLATAFSDAGVVPGSKVAEYLYNSPEYLETYFAALKVRAVPVNVNYRYLDDELLYLLDNSDAEVLVFHSSRGAVSLGSGDGPPRCGCSLRSTTAVGKSRASRPSSPLSAATSRRLGSSAAATTSP